MDWNRYKALCDTPQVCSRWLLEQTLELLAGDPDRGAADPRHQQAAAQLRRVLAGQPLEKPADHRGGPVSDMFATTLSLADVRVLRAVVDRAITQDRRTRATAGRGLGGFAEAWLEYQRHLEGRQPQDPQFCSTRS
jgi:hypothetical protein